MPASLGSSKRDLALMGSWAQAKQSLERSALGLSSAPTSTETEQFIERALKSQADKYEQQIQELRLRAEPLKAYRRPPLEQFLDPRGNGGIKPFGVGFDVLRMFARRNPWVRAAITIRKREIATAGWDIVPALENQQHELESLAALVRSIQQFPDRASALDRWEPFYVPKETTQELIQATRKPDITLAEMRQRFYLGLSDLRIQAGRHAAQVRELFKHPNKHPQQQWRHILSAIVEDLLTLDTLCLELRRTQYPLAPEFPVEQQVPKYDNRIVELHPVDAATIRPCIDEHGMLLGEDDPYENAYEQWIDNQEVVGWKRHQLLFMQEHPTTDVHMHGYSFGRVEGLFYTLILMAKADQADFNEFKRDFFGGFLYLGESQDMESLEEFRAYIEEELEGDKKIPLLAGFPKETNYIPTTSSNSSKEARRTERQRNFLHRVAAMFEMPLLKLSIADATNYRNSDVGSDMMDDGLRSLMESLDETMTQGIVHQSGYTDIAYKTAPNHQRDREKQLANLEKELELGLADINDGRIELGRPPQEDGERSLPAWKAYEEAKGRAQGQAAAAVDADPVTPDVEGGGPANPAQNEKNPNPPPNPAAIGGPSSASAKPKGNGKEPKARGKGNGKNDIPDDVQRSLTQPLLQEARRYHATHGRWPELHLETDVSDELPEDTDDEH